MDVVWGETFGRRTAQGTPIVPVRNMVFESNRTNRVDGKSWFTRPGLDVLFVATPYTMTGVFQQAGVFDGDTFVAGGSLLYRGPALGGFSPLGTITSDNGAFPVTGAATGERLVIASGGTAYSYNGATLTAITMPAGEVVHWVAYIAGLFILGVRNSQAFYWMAYDEAAPDPLHVYSAESQPDNIEFGFSLGSVLVLVGSSGTEFWQANSGANPDDPLSPVSAADYAHGTCNARSVAVLADRYFFVDQRRGVYRGGQGAPQRISTPDIEERLRLEGADASAIIGWAFEMDGHTYYCVIALNSATSYVYDEATQNWYQWDTNGGPWLAQGGYQVSAEIIYGFSGAVLYRVGMQYTTDATTPIIPTIRGFIPVVGKPVRHDSLNLPLQGIAPGRTVTLNGSDRPDHALTGSGTFTRTLNVGRSTVIDQTTTERQLGLMREPGRLLELTANGPFSVTYVEANTASDA